MNRTTIKEVLRNTAPGQQVTVCGWVRTRRDSKGGFSFLEINDGSCLQNLQVIAGSTLANYDNEVKQLHPGGAIAASGTLQASPGAGQAVELQADRLQVFGFSDPTVYPLQKGRVSFERLREVAHLRARTNTFGAVMRVRNALAQATHRFFQERGFYYVNTPIITANDCEGAGAMFQVTCLNLLNVPRTDQGQIDYHDDFFGRKTNLTVSGQLEGEVMACALGNIYTFGPTFRAENSNTRRHLAEFWMVEPEMAFADLRDDAALAEEFLRCLFQTVLSDCAEDMDFFSQRIKPGIAETIGRLAESVFETITYTDAVKLLEKAQVGFEFPVFWGAELQSEHEQYLSGQVFARPVIVTDYPRDIKPFYMRVNDDERTVAAMDVLLPEVGEIIGGSQREERYDVLTARMTQAGLDPQDYWWFLDLRRFGTVPHAGFGLGFERLVQFCTGMANIRDVIPFPRVPNNAEF